MELNEIHLNGLHGLNC